MSHFVGVGVHEPSRPLPIWSPPFPEPCVLIQPKPWFSMSAASGAGPTRAASPAPWHLPKVWPPAVSATVS